MEKNIAQMYANALQKAMKSGNYENFTGNRSVNPNGNDVQLVIDPSQFPQLNIDPTLSQAQFNLPAMFQPTPATMPQGSYTGEIAFRIVRATSKINAPLPIPFGSAFSYAQNYLQVLQSLCPSGVTVSSVAIATDTNTITITYTNGTDSDIVTIYGDTYNLLSFNQGLYSRRAITNLIRYTTPDNSAIYNQVSSTPSRPFKTTWLSNTSVDRNTLSLTPSQYNKNVFDILAPTELSEERGFGMYAFADFANKTTALTYTVQMFFNMIGKI